MPPPFDPPCREVSERALVGELDHKLRRDLPVAPRLYLEALYRLGMISRSPTEVYPRLLDFYASQVLGFYEPHGDEMVIVEGAPIDEAMGRFVWAHELDHAAQERRFRLPSRLLAMGADSDAQRAASAIAEGEAMLVGFVLELPASTDESKLADLAEALENESRDMPAPDGVPEFFVTDLLFPYTAGFAAVLRAYRAGGWHAVDGLLAHPPPATAVLLHPDRASPPGRPLADGDLPVAPAGYETVLTDTLGEWGLSFWLSRRLPKPAADELAAGWDGDRLRLVREQARPERWALVWRLRCRSVPAREALERALQATLPSLLANLDGGVPPTLVWVTAGGTLELRAGWSGGPSAPR